MSFDKLKSFLEGNEDALNVVSELEQSQISLTKKLNTLEVDSKKAFESRDEVKSKLNLVKTKFGIEDIDEDNLAKILNSKGGNDAELQNLKKLISQTTAEKEQIEQSYKLKLANFALKTELQKTGLAQRAVDTDAYEFLEAIALKGAHYSDDGLVIFKNEDGSTMYNGAKPMTLADKVDAMLNSPKWAHALKPEGKNGTTTTVTTSGGNTPTIKRHAFDAMNPMQKSDFMKRGGKITE